MHQDPNGHLIAYINCRYRCILKDRMKGCGETANHTRKPPAKYREIYSKNIYIEKSLTGDKRQSLNGRLVMLLKTKQIEQKSKMTLVAFFGVGREKLLFLTQKRVKKKDEHGSRTGRNRVEKGSGKLPKMGANE